MSKLADEIMEATAVILVKEGGKQKLLPRTKQMAIVFALDYEWDMKHAMNKTDAASKPSPEG